jgi:hypothetical protein
MTFSTDLLFLLNPRMGEVFGTSSANHPRTRSGPKSCRNKIRLERRVLSGEFLQNNLHDPFHDVLHFRREPVPMIKSFHLDSENHQSVRQSS